MKAFLSGGCKNGKSTFGENIAVALAHKDDLPLYYLATMIPADEEDEARILRHRKMRQGRGFCTLERGRNIHRVLEQVSGEGVFLLDSVTALVANEMFLPNGEFNGQAGAKVCQDVEILLGSCTHFVAVSDYLYSDAQIYDETTSAYRCALAQADRMLAKKADMVLEICGTNPLIYKGREAYEALV